MLKNWASERKVVSSDGVGSPVGTLVGDGVVVLAVAVGSGDAVGDAGVAVGVEVGTGAGVVAAGGAAVGGVEPGDAHAAISRRAAELVTSRLMTWRTRIASSIAWPTEAGIRDCTPGQVAPVP